MSIQPTQLKIQHSIQNPQQFDLEIIQTKTQQSDNNLIKLKIIF
jgi:hypothetical protein